MGNSPAPGGWGNNNQPLTTVQTCHGTSVQQAQTNLKLAP